MISHWPKTAEAHHLLTPRPIIRFLETLTKFVRRRKPKTLPVFAVRASAARGTEASPLIRPGGPA
jgi:hypothetical protein